MSKKSALLRCVSRLAIPVVIEPGSTVRVPAAVPAASTSSSPLNPLKTPLTGSSPNIARPLNSTSLPSGSTFQVPSGSRSTISA